MEQIKNSILELFQHKLKFMILSLSVLFFMVLLFPFGDLSDLISTQVSKLSGNTVYLSLENMKLSFIPHPGMQLERIFIETNKIPGLSVKELVITPSIAGLASQKPYGHISAKGLLNGSLDLHVSKGAQTENGIERQKIDLKVDKMSLLDIRSLASLPIVLKGNLNLESNILADLSFQEQPEVELKLNVQKFEMPPANINTMMGPLTLPELKMSKIELKGRLSAGRFIIESGTIGSSSDELFGSITGSLDMRLDSSSGSPAPQIGAYSIDIDLTAKQSFQDKANLFLSFISSYRKETSAGANYRFKISALNIQSPPNFSIAR